MGLIEKILATSTIVAATGAIVHVCMKLSQLRKIVQFTKVVQEEKHQSQPHDQDWRLPNL